MDAHATVRDYYEALRRGEPLYPYFAEASDVVKFGIGERLTGCEAVAAGLREQTRTTDAWTVRSERLRVTERDCHAWFSDDVFMAWTDTERNIRFEFDTRWSGTLERRTGRSDAADSDSGDGDGDTAADDSDDRWLFVGMHVSTEDDT